MANPCYNGPNPIKDEERMTIWNWAKTDGGLDAGTPIEKVSQNINDHFFGGQAKPEWIRDIIGGNKTPFKEVAMDMWKKQYNRRTAIRQAQETSTLENMTPMGKFLRKLWTFPRTVAVAGHGIVFPITHAGDLIFRPSEWGTFLKGTLDTYKGANPFGGRGKAFTEQALRGIEGDEMYDLGLRGGVDMGARSHPSGLISRTYEGAATRAWDMLTVLRFNLWKKAVLKNITPDMTEAQKLDVATNMAEWANHATGSGKGIIANVGGEGLFGPKLTQAKINKLFPDTIKTIKTFANWDDATVGEKAVAQQRLSGATQFLATNLGFLAVNAGFLKATGSKDAINVTDPTKSDFMAFKGEGIVGNVPGLHTEIKTLANILATSFATRKQLKGESKFERTAKTVGQYGMAKLTPTIQRALEVGLGQNWLGRPLPWSTEAGTSNKPRLTWGEYLGSIGPIPLEGPIGYVYDHLRKTGASSLDATSIVKALIITGLGVPGLHVREEYKPPQQAASPALK